MKITIRKAVGNDVLIMAELWKEMMDFHKERDRFYTRTASGHETYIDFITGHISKEDSCVLVAENEKKVVGHCLGFITENPPVITTERYGFFQEIAVGANYRRCGIGQELVKEMLKWFRDHNMKRIEVRVSVRNELSIVFWRKMGFVPFAERLYMEI